MEYRNDPNLDFLAQVPSSDLDLLVGVLTKNKKGGTRLTEKLTSNPTYQKHYPDHNRYWKLIAAELQCFGANSLVTKFRGGKGVPYRDILINVCDKQKVNYNKSADIASIESCLLMKILAELMADTSSDDLEEISKELNLNTKHYTPQAVFAAIQVAVQISGFTPYKASLIVANVVAKKLLGHGISFAGNILLMRLISSLAGPIGWGLVSIWTAIDIAGPAYRVTVPATIQVAYLRSKALHEEGE